MFRFPLLPHKRADIRYRQTILAPLESLVQILMNALSRKFEWEADAFACELQSQLNTADLGDRLGKALITLRVKNLSTVWVDWL